MKEQAIMKNAFKAFLRILKEELKKEDEKRDSGHCPICNHKINAREFKDRKDFTFFTISGYCQNCITIMKGAINADKEQNKRNNKKQQ